MPRVATPDRRSKIIESEADLKALQTEYKLSSTLVANLRQLLGRAGQASATAKAMRTTEARREAPPLALTPFNGSD